MKALLSFEITTEIAEKLPEDTIKELGSALVLCPCPTQKIVDFLLLHEETKLIKIFLKQLHNVIIEDNALRKDLYNLGF